MKVVFSFLLRFYFFFFLFSFFLNHIVSLKTPSSFASGDENADAIDPEMKSFSFLLLCLEWSSSTSNVTRNVCVLHNAWFHPHPSTCVFHVSWMIQF